MADIADDADRTIEQALQHNILQAQRSMPVIAPVGHCLNCGETSLPDGSPWPEAQRWCDVDCKTDWSRATGVR